MPCFHKDEDQVLEWAQHILNSPYCRKCRRFGSAAVVILLSLMPGRFSGYLYEQDI